MSNFEYIACYSKLYQDFYEKYFIFRPKMNNKMFPFSVFKTDTMKFNSF